MDPSEGERPGPKTYRFHHNRHTASTRPLRAASNLATVQRLPRHEKIETTMRYAHVNDADLMKLMELAATESPVKSPVQLVEEDRKASK